MKIVVQKKDETICYVQLRDLIYLASGNMNSFRKLSNKYMDEGKNMTDFVRVSDKSMVDIIVKIEDIIDFNEYKNYSVDILSRLLVSKNLFGDGSKRIDRQTRDIQDIMAFKNGQLNYSIPLIMDDRINEVISGVTVTSTNFDSMFVLRNLNEELYDENILDRIRDLLINQNLLKDDVEYSYKVKQSEDCHILTFVPLKKKKKNVFQLLMKKKRTE